MTWIFWLALYLAIPAVSIWITSRMITWQGWVVFLLLWPIAWLWEGPEELP